MKKELEEAANIWITKNSGIKTLLIFELVKESFKEGANWQAERMYTEEDVLELLKKFDTDADIGHFNGPTKRNQWFNKYKKI
jgi:hypothetical protein